jgi:hypothetical protein
MRSRRVGGSGEWEEQGSRKSREISGAEIGGVGKWPNLVTQRSSEEVIGVKREEQRGKGRLGRGREGKGEQHGGC